MNTVIQIQVGNCNGSANRHSNIGSTQNTVYIQLCRITIQPCSIALGCIFVCLTHQCNGIGGYCLTVNRNTFCIFITNNHTGKVGILAVNSSIRIVYCNVVYIVSNILIIIVTSCTGCIMAVDLNIFEGRIVIQYIPAKIVPSAIINSSIGCQIICQFVVHTSAATVSCSETGINIHRCSNQFSRNIHPETNLCCVCKIKGFGKEEVHLTVAGCGNVGPIDIYTHSIVAISDHTAITVHQIYLCRDIHTNRSIVLLSKESVCKITVCTCVADEPSVRLTFSGSYFGINVNKEFTVFEIVNNIRCLTETDLSSNCFICLSADNCCNGTAGETCTFVASSKLAIRDSTKICIRQSINDILFCICNGIKTAVGSYVNRYNHCIAITDNDFFLFESNVGGYDSYRTFTDNLVIINKLCRYYAFLTIGDKETVVINSSHRIISKLPFSIFGNLSYRTYKVGTESVKLNGVAGSIIIIFGSNVSTYKLTRCRSCRDNKDTVCGRSLCTVGRRTV